MDLQSLPPELLGLILDQLVHTDLTNLCRVSRHFVPPAQERLFASYPGASRHPTRIYKFILTLIRRPDLAKFVKRIDLCLDDGSGPDVYDGPAAWQVTSYLRSVTWLDDAAILEPVLARLGLLERGPADYHDEDFGNTDDEFESDEEEQDEGPDSDGFQGHINRGGQELDEDNVSGTDTSEDTSDTDDQRVLDALNRQWANSLHRSRSPEESHRSLESRNDTKMCKDTIAPQEVTMGYLRPAGYETPQHPKRISFRQLWSYRHKGRVHFSVHATVLFALVPNLTTLRIDSDWCPSVSRAQRNPKNFPTTIDWKTILATGPNCSNTALSKLKSIELVARKSLEGINSDYYPVHDDGREERVIDDVWWDQVDASHMLQIPSLSQLTFSGAFELRNRAAFPHSSINITLLTFTRMGLDSCARIANLIEACNTLHEFSCHFAVEQDMYSAGVIWTMGIIYPLICHEHTLRKLMLSVSESIPRDCAPGGMFSLDTYQHMDSYASTKELKAFTALEELEIDADILRFQVHPDEDESVRVLVPPLPERLSDTISPALKHLKLRKVLRMRKGVDEKARARGYNLTMPSTRRWLLDFAGDLEFGSLKTLELQMMCGSHVGEREEVVRAFKQAGCEMSFSKFDGRMAG